MKRKAKNRVILVSIMILLLGTLLLGCVKPDPPIGPEELKPTLEVSTIPAGVLPYGSEFTLSWTTTNAKSLLINNKQHYPIETGSLKIRLFKDTIFEVRALNIVLSAKFDKEVKVGDWTTSKIGLISHSYWQKTAVRAYRDGILLYDYPLSQYEKDEKNFFGVDGKYRVYRYDERIGFMDWGFLGDGEFVVFGLNTSGADTLKVSLLNEGEMILSKIQPYSDGLPCLAEATFERK